MPEPKQPTDHQPKKQKAPEPDEFFTFTSQGEPVTVPVATTDALGAKFVRENRRRDEVDFVLTAFEAMAGEGKEAKAVTDAFDAMSADEWKQFQKDFRDHLGATLGE
jgi:hypothetical protein